MIFRIYPTKDTTVTNDFRYPPNYTKLTGSNLGASEELQVFKRAGLSGGLGSLASSSLGRSLLQFDFSQFCALTASGDLPSTGLSFRLRMNHKTVACTLPTSFDLVVQPVSTSWDEGNGRDVGRLADNGFANWERPKSTVYWTTFGGDFLPSPTASMHFDTGKEDLDVDVTQIVDQWLSGTVPNNGIVVRMTASIEADALYTDYYLKKFYSRQSDYEDRRPYIEARTDDSVRDDRVNMQWGRSGSLFMYNLVGGAFQNLPASNIYVGIGDASGVFVYLTASQGVYPGIYSVNLALPTGSSYSGSVFYDTWGSGSFAFGTGSFTVSSAGPVESVFQKPLTARMRNLQDEYLPEDVPVFEVFFRRHPHTLPVVQTASLTTDPYVVEQAYYAIENDSTRERVIPFGTGSQHHTRLSYGANGNSFKLFMSNLHSGNVYRVIFLVLDQGRQQVIDPGFKFKVV